MKIYVALNGNDSNDGTKERPFKTIQKAQIAVREAKLNGQNRIHVKISEGKYYLSQPIQLKAEDSGTLEHPIVYEGMGNVTLSGGIPLELNWEEYGNGIYKAKLKEMQKIDQLFVNGKSQIMARYPNYQEKARYYNGYSKDSFNQERIKKYKSPKGGFMHVMHEGLWGDFHFEITGFDNNGELAYVGGHQNNRPSKMHESIRYIENIFEELDSEGEWFLDEESWMLYYKPSPDIDFNDCSMDGIVLKNLMSFVGTQEEPVKNIVIENICFQGACRTFMEPMEPLLRSDWCVCRNGAVYLEGTERIRLNNCEINQVGGNGICISKYNRFADVSACYIHDTGASSILFVGDVNAVRSPLFHYEDIYEDPDAIDWEPGPRNNSYPSNCTVYDNLITRCGRVEKQAAGVCISMSQKITVSHNSIYDVPRAGVNICDGTWGGHIIEYNNVFHTVLETSDHGAFNSWGRDRYWDCRYEVMEKSVEQNVKVPLLDTTIPIIIKNNCFECSHGWDIDLDDGSSNYQIYNNICLRGGIKNREGVYREVYNNIILNNTFHPHLWFEKSGDKFYRNIIFKNYADIGLKGWGEKMDNNILHNEVSGAATQLQEKSHQDEHSIYAKVQFVDMLKGDFRLKKSEDIVQTGFKDIDASQCGVISMHLKKMAITPFADGYVIDQRVEKDISIYEFNGLQLKLLSGLGEVSATGMYQESGIYVIKVENDSFWNQRGICSNDVILTIDQEDIMDVKTGIDLLKRQPKEIVVWRGQGKRILS
ncbi:MAG: right-handed parallel beta-helix repeat-containing protein [Anaerocolumna sp.]